MDQRAQDMAARILAQRAVRAAAGASARPSKRGRPAGNAADPIVVDDSAPPRKRVRVIIRPNSASRARGAPRHNRCGSSSRCFITGPSRPAADTAHERATGSPSRPSSSRACPQGRRAHGKRRSTSSSHRANEAGRQPQPDYQGSQAHGGAAKRDYHAAGGRCQRNSESWPSAGINHPRLCSRAAVGRRSHNRAH